MRTEKPRTPYKVLADELIASGRHPYRVWPASNVGDPCCDCSGPADDWAHRDLSYLLYEAGLRSAEEVFNPAAGFWDPMKAQAIYREKVRVKVEAKDAKQANDLGGKEWKRTKKVAPS